jgi:hypothetical protein
VTPRSAWTARQIASIFVLARTWAPVGGLDGSSNLTPDEISPTSKNIVADCKNFVTQDPFTLVLIPSKIYRPDFPIPTTGGEDAVLVPGDPSTRWILVESSSGLKTGAEHVRSVQTYAAARRTDGYWTSGLGSFPSRVSHHSSRL